MKYLITAFLLILVGVFYFYEYDQTAEHTSTTPTALNDIKQASSVNSYEVRQSIAPIEARSSTQGLVTSALDAKLKNERNLDELKTTARLVEDMETIILELKAKGIELPPDLLERMNNNSLTDADFKILMEHVFNVLPEGEVEFRKQILGFDMNFGELSQLYAERSKITGLNYEQEMMHNPQIYKDISIGEIDDLLAKGNILPTGVVNHISQYHRVDLLNHLYERGYLTDLNYVSPYTHRNAVEEFVYRYASTVTNIPNAAVIDESNSLGYLDRLLAVGVAPNPNDSTRDALDFAIQNMSEKNANKVSILMQKLLDAGLSVDASHIELLKQFQSAHPAEYEQYVRPVLGGYSKSL